MTQDKSNRWVEEGDHLYQVGNYQGAIDTYDKALAVNPTFAKALISRGNALSQLGRYQEALEYFDKALLIDTDDDVTWIVKTITLNKLGRHNESIEIYNKILDKHPDWVLLRSFRSDCQLQSGRYQEAIESCEELLKLDSEDSWAWKTKNEAIRQLDDWLRARRPPNAYVELYELVGSAEKRLHIFI